MKRTSICSPSLSPHFIGAWSISRPNICDRLVAYFESNVRLQRKGITSGGSEDIKNSVDITITPSELKTPGAEVFEDYFEALHFCYEDYLDQWPFLQKFARDIQIGSFNLQKYGQGQHFQGEHCERSSLDTLHRLFAFMTYLNDVEDGQGGVTEFTHYNCNVRPRKGLTMIWPVDWTHAHKGQPIQWGEKYIITGWMNFPVNI